MLLLDAFAIMYQFLNMERVGFSSFGLLYLEVFPKYLNINVYQFLKVVHVDLQHVQFYLDIIMENKIIISYFQRNQFYFDLIFIKYLNMLKKIAFRAVVKKG